MLIEIPLGITEINMEWCFKENFSECGEIDYVEHNNIQGRSFQL